MLLLVIAAGVIGLGIWFGHSINREFCRVLSERTANAYARGYQQGRLDMYRLLHETADPALSADPQKE